MAKRKYLDEVGLSVIKDILDEDYALTVDSALSTTSENPVQNKVITEALESKANLTDIPTTLPANGGNADTLDGKHASDFALKLDIPTTLPANGGTANAARETVSPNAKAKLWEDDEGGNLRLTSPDGSHYVEMDCCNNEMFRMYFVGDGDAIQALTYNFTTKKLSINGNADTLDGLHANDLAYMTNVVGGLRRGWASTDIGIIMTYGDREVAKTTNDLSYFGWTINDEGWFNPIVVSQYPSGTNYTMFGNIFGYDISQDSERSSFAYKGRTYYACWSSGSSYQNPAVVGGLHLTLTNNDYISACKTLIDASEAIDSDTVDGKHAEEFASVRKITTQEEVDSMLESGIYSVEDLAVPTAFGSIQSPYYMLIVNKYRRGDGDYNVELAIPYYHGWQQGVYYRNCSEGTWGKWSNVADGGNADTLDGKHASDFMPISGEARKYGVIRMNESDGIYARHIDGNNSEYDGSLYLNYHCPNAPIYMNGGNTAIHSGNIGSQSVNYANSAGSAQPIFNNSTWYSVGDDVQIGDHNVVGGLGILGINGHTRIDLCQSGNPSNFKSITFDGTTLNLEGNADTVDGYHAHQLQCENEYGNPYSYSIISKWNAEGDSRFKLMEESGQYQTKVDYANSAGTANTAGASATTASNICLRNLSSGTAAANTTNCPSGAWYGKHS